jgi:hypothetical protein
MIVVQSRKVPVVVAHQNLSRTQDIGGGLRLFRDRGRNRAAAVAKAAPVQF